MRALRLLFVLLFSFFLHAATLTGVVRTPGGLPIEGATVDAGGRTALTDTQGRFSLDTADGATTVRVSRSGFEGVTVNAEAAAQITLQPVLAESIVVSGIRAEAKTPVTKSDVERADIVRDYHGQDIPLLLRETPSVNAYTEAGVGGSGYSYISLRGISPSRLNFT